MATPLPTSIDFQDKALEAYINWKKSRLVGVNSVGIARICIERVLKAIILNEPTLAVTKFDKGTFNTLYAKMAFDHPNVNAMFGAGTCLSLVRKNMSFLGKGTPLEICFATIKKHGDYDIHGDGTFSPNEIADIEIKLLEIMEWFMSDYLRKPSDWKEVHVETVIRNVQVNVIVDQIKIFLNEYLKEVKVNPAEVEYFEKIIANTELVISKLNALEDNIVNRVTEINRAINFESEERIKTAIAEIKTIVLPRFIKLLQKPDKSSEPNTLKVETFSDFLNSQHLPYYSRGKFRQEILIDLDKSTFLAENDLVKFILEDECYGLIIHGQGGIGKTRLTLEIGKRLLFKYYVVIDVLAEFNDFDKLVDFLNLNPDTKYVLLFDYIEVQNVFEKIARWITKERLHNIKIIGNCRNTFISNIRNNFIDYFKFIDIGLERKFERSYKREVILSIVNSIPDEKLAKQLKNKDVLKAFYEARPSFAAFIKYINLKKKPEEDLEIASNESFSNWLLKRLKLTITKTPDHDELFENGKGVFQLLSCLPANANSSSKIQDLYEDEINKLLKDGWVDETEFGLKVVHDSVNDSLLIEFLKFYEFRESCFNGLLKFALTLDGFSSMMWSLQRIWDLVPVDKLNKLRKVFINFISTNLETNSLQGDWLKNKLDTTQLISEEDRINLFIKHKDLFKENFRLEKFGSSLAYSMEWVNEKIYDKKLKEYYAEELNLLFLNYWNIDGRFNDFVKSSRGGKIISSYINLYGIDVFIKARFSEFISLVECKPESLESISLAITSWLNNKGDMTKNLKDLVRKWFDIYYSIEHNFVDPTYLIENYLDWEEDNMVKKNVTHKILLDSDIKLEERAKIIGLWLEKCDDCVFVEPFIPQFLDAVIPNKTAYYIIGYWLQKSNNPLLVKPFLAKWLSNPVEPGICSFIYKFWLEKGDEPNLIIDPIKRWFLITVDSDTMGSALKNIIKADGNFLPIRSETIEWLTQNSSNSNSVTILGLLLKTWVDKSTISDFEIPTSFVLRDHSKLREIGFTIGYWLEKGGNLTVVQPYINDWLKLFWNSDQSAIIIGNWLENGGNFEAVSEFIVPLLQIGELEKEKSTLMLNWVKYGNNCYLIKDFVLSFFAIKENQEFYKSRYLITSWLQKTNLPLHVKTAIKPWLSVNGNNPESIFICSFWINKGGEIDLVEDYLRLQFEIHASLKQSYRVIINWLRKKGNPDLIKLSILKYLDYNWNEEQAIELVKMLLMLNKYIEEISEYIFSIVRSLGYNPFVNFIDIVNVRIIIKSNFAITSRLKIIENESLKLSKKIKEHLISKQSPDKIKKEVIEFLMTNGTEKFASWVIAAWIEYTNDIPLIQNFLIEWLEINLLVEPNSSFVIAASLEKEITFNLVYQKAIEWLNVFDKTYNAKFPLSSWLKLKGNFGSKEIELWIIDWHKNFYNVDKHNWRDDLILDYISFQNLSQE